jgi:hypothetical protein
VTSELSESEIAAKQEDYDLIESIVELMAELARLQPLLEADEWVGSASSEAFIAACDELEHLTAHLSPRKVEAVFGRAGHSYARYALAMVRAVRATSDLDGDARVDAIVRELYGRPKERGDVLVN